MTVNVSGNDAGTFGSVPLSVKEPLTPGKSESGATALTVGALFALTVTVVVAVLEPALLDTVSERSTGPAATGAVKTGFAMVGSESEPWAGVAQANVSGAVPVALPLRVIVPPDATV